MKPILIFIPGNPSIPGIYDDFLETLKKELNLFKIYNLIHLGQDPTESMDFDSISLSDVVDDHRKKVDFIIKDHPDSRFIVIAHSLGATVASTLCLEFEEKLDSVYFLMPFLYLSGKNKYIVKLMSYGVLQNIFYFFICFVLNFEDISHSLFIRFGKEKSNLVKAYISNKRYLKNLSMLLKSYQLSFANNDYFKPLPFCNLKLHFLFAKNDLWSPSSMTQKLPGRVFSIVDNEVSHDFCLLASDSQKVVHHIKKWHVNNNDK